MAHIIDSMHYPDPVDFFAGEFDELRAKEASFFVHESPQISRSDRLRRCGRAMFAGVAISAAIASGVVYAKHNNADVANEMQRREDLAEQCETQYTEAPIELQPEYISVCKAEALSGHTKPR